MRQHLSPWAQNFWDRNGVKFFCGRYSFYFHGSTGLVFRLLNFAIDHIFKIREPLQNWFDATTLEKQQQIYVDRFQKPLMKLVKWFTDNNLLNWLRGVPPQQYHQTLNHYKCSVGEIHQKWIDELFRQVPSTDNYFWRVVIYGEYSQSCCPNYLKHENFLRLKTGLVDRISVHTESVESFLRHSNESISHFVLLDHMDWLSTNRYEELVLEWQEIINHSKPSSRILFRSLLSNADYLNAIRIKVNNELFSLVDILKFDRRKASELHQQDRCHVYGSFYIGDLHTKV